MQRFKGMTIKPFCVVSELAPVRIDRVWVQVRRTLFGAIEYDVMGALGEAGRGWPVCRPMPEAGAALDEAEGWTRRIEQARRQEHEKKDHLEPPGRAV